MPIDILASRFIYPKDIPLLEESLLAFRGLKLQIAFFQRRDFLQLDHKRIKNICQALNIDIPTVHAPCIDVLDEAFLDTLTLIKEIYNVKVISIHPQRGERLKVMDKLKEISWLIKKLDLVLAYENFPEKTRSRKWISLPEEMYAWFDLDFLKITFDTSHLDNPQDCLLQFKRVKDKVEVVHLSDKNTHQRHLPLGKGNLPYQEFLDHLRAIDFKGFVVLEYLECYRDELLRDLSFLKNFLG